MFKKLWKLVRSDEKVARALRQPSVGHDLNPHAPHFAVNDEPKQAVRPEGAKLWLQDWDDAEAEAAQKKATSDWDNILVR